jgi:hypothetical protein
MDVEASTAQASRQPAVDALCFCSRRQLPTLSISGGNQPYRLRPKNLKGAEERVFLGE